MLGDVSVSQPTASKPRRQPARLQIVFHSVVVIEGGDGDGGGIPKSRTSFEMVLLAFSGDPA